MKSAAKMIVLCLCLLASGLFCVPVWAQEAKSDPGAVGDTGETERQRVANQMANVERLLEKSSGAKRVMASDNELAKKIRQDAIARFGEARKALDAGEAAQAQQLLVDATKTMFQAVRILGRVPEDGSSGNREFDEREASARALLSALHRIAEAEGGADHAAEIIADVTKTIDAAKALRDAGKAAEARATLSAGYEKIKAAVETMRDGKTLVRSLKFDNEKDEFQYELNRNDSHQMLVRVLVKDKDAGEGANIAIEPYVKRAADLRVQAEQKSKSGDHRAAIQLLEQSTKELVRAIRSAGIFIPE